MTDNMKLWSLVEKTPHEHTKSITGKSYKGTSPKPHYLVQRATEVFGPVGIGWGFTIEERVEEGALIEPGFFEKMHVAKVKVWYVWNDKRGEVEHIGGTVFSGRYSSGKTFTDEDAPKKSATDALVKALSMIGFAGDIFMGRYDDSKYVQGLKEEATAVQDTEATVNLWSELTSLTTLAGLGSFWKDNAGTIAGMSKANKEKFTAEKDRLKSKFSSASDTVKDIQDTFGGAKVVNETFRELHNLEAGE